MARGWCYTNRSLVSATFHVACVLVYSIHHSFVQIDGFPVRLCILPIISVGISFLSFLVYFFFVIFALVLFLFSPKSETNATPKVRKHWYNSERTSNAEDPT